MFNWYWYTYMFHSEGTAHCTELLTPYVFRILSPWREVNSFIWLAYWYRPWSWTGVHLSKASSVTTVLLGHRVKYSFAWLYFILLLPLYQTKEFSDGQWFWTRGTSVRRQRVNHCATEAVGCLISLDIYIFNGEPIYYLRQGPCQHRRFESLYVPP